MYMRESFLLLGEDIIAILVTSKRFSSRVLVFHQLRLSMEHHVRVSINAPGWGLVNLSQLTQHPPKLSYSYQNGRGGS